jgi:putative ABC transport system ATP-binding protein
MMPAIRMAGLTKTYGEGALQNPVLRGVDLEVARGELLMLVGPSGSGKTTLLSILGCVLRPSGGEAWLFDRPLHGLRESDLPSLRLSYVGFVFQGHNLIPGTSAEDNVMLPMLLRGFAPKEAAREARALLARVGLDRKYASTPEELSGGQRQRVAIARALAGNPPLILADEPTASLDAATGREVSVLFRELCVERGHTVVCVTHDDRIYDLADRIVTMEDGRVTEARPKERASA